MRMHPPQSQLAEIYLHFLSLVVLSFINLKNHITFFIKSLKISYTSVFISHCRRRSNYNNFFFLSFMKLSLGFGGFLYFSKYTFKLKWLKNDKTIIASHVIFQYINLSNAISFQIIFKKINVLSRWFL